jgi:hypothetical protein
MFYFPPMMQNNPQNTSLPPIINLQRYLSQTQSCIQLPNNILSSVWQPLHRLDLHFLRQPHNFPHHQTTIYLTCKKGTNHLEQTLLFLNRRHIHRLSRTTTQHLTLLSWQTITTNQIEQNLVLVQHSLVALVTQ